MTLSLNIVANPESEVISELLKVQNLENELSTVWTREQMSAIKSQASEARSEATSTIDAAEKASDQIMDEAYGLFGAAASQMAMGAAIIGIGFKSGVQSRGIKKGINTDKDFLEGLKKTTPGGRVSSNTGEASSSEPTAEQETLINAEWDKGAKFEDYKESADLLDEANRKELSKAKENTRDRIKDKESRMRSLDQNHQNLIQTMQLLSGSFRDSFQAGMKLQQAAAKTAEGEAEAKKIIHQQTASIDQSAQQTAEKGEQAFTKGAQDIPQLLSEIENANLFRA